ncbi:MAG: ABC transporter permease [Bacteroidota bacterium]|nr:ABC transporter permease [Bacteroidota bacterium]
MLFTLAWRNIWRNTRRSLIILTSIVVGLAAMIFMEGLARGLMRQTLENQLGAHVAHIQIHKRGFNDNKVVQNFMVNSDSILSVLPQYGAIKTFSERTIAFGLLSSATNSSGVSIVGIRPSQEEKVTTIKRSLIEGRYLSGEPREIVLSKRLSESLNIGLGDRVVAMASALDGKIGSEVFRVVGIYHTSNSSFDKMHIFIPMQNAQEMLHAGSQTAEVAILAGSIDSVQTLKNNLEKKLGSDYEVLSFYDLVPSLVKQIEVTDQMMIVYYLIIGVAMIFGIINTMLMSVFERIHEFGVLKAMGMKESKLFSMVVIEAFLLGVVGTLTGTIIGISITLVLQKTGLNFASFAEGLSSWGFASIVYPLMDYSSVMTNVMVILFICILAAMYPAYRAVKLEPINAIRYV